MSQWPVISHRTLYDLRTIPSGQWHVVFDIIHTNKHSCHYVQHNSPHKVISAMPKGFLQDGYRAPSNMFLGACIERDEDVLKLFEATSIATARYVAVCYDMRRLDVLSELARTVGPPEVRRFSQLVDFHGGYRESLAALAEHQKLKYFYTQREGNDER